MPKINRSRCLLVCALSSYTIAALFAVFALLPAPAAAQTFSAQIQQFWNLLRTGNLTFLVPPKSTAGGGAGTFKSSGILCDSVAGSCGCTTFTDAGVQNQWNVLTCTLPAATLATNGDEIRMLVEYEAAANSNTKEMQVFWNGGTCGGTSAALCTTGTTAWGTGVTNTSSGASMTASFRIKRTASGAQSTFAIMRASTANIGQDAKAATVTDTAAIPVVFGIRNTAAAAASTQAPTPTMTIQYLGQ